MVTQVVRAGGWSHLTLGKAQLPPHPQQLHDELPVLLVLVPVLLLHLLHFTLQEETAPASEMTTLSSFATTDADPMIPFLPSIPNSFRAVHQ